MASHMGEEWTNGQIGWVHFYCILKPPVNVYIGGVFIDIGKITIFITL